MNNYVTLFNSTYLPQGLSLYQSMLRNIPKFCLWVVCVDSMTYNFLLALNLKYLKLINLEDIECDVLKGLRHDRTMAEYCWTLTPFAPEFVFNADSKVNTITYIDADLCFFQDPSKIYELFLNSGCDVLITDHDYEGYLNFQKKAGLFCVQFIIFKKNESADILKWWKLRCIEWCFNKFEDDKFGDQKYLDQWPIIFNDRVYILENHEYAQAPWNCNKYSQHECIFYHFHSLRIVSEKLILLSNNAYHLNKNTVTKFYEVYAKLLFESIDLLISHKFPVKPQFLLFSISSIFYFYRGIRRFIFTRKISGSKIFIIRN